MNIDKAKQTEELNQDKPEEMSHVREYKSRPKR